MEDYVIIGQLIGLVIAFLIALLVKRDAASRGMSSWLGAIGVFLFMILFLPIYFLVRKERIRV